MKTRTVTPSITTKIGRTLADWAGGITARRTRNRDIAETWREIRKLDNSILRDIGIDRSEIGLDTAFDRLKNRK